MNILVSACLLGINCKYNGDNNFCENVVRMGDKHTLIPVCPEQLGGLTTPREASEICGGKVINKLGDDVTSQYEKGAQEALKIAKLCGCDVAVLKKRSPSCGVGEVYDGTFSKRLVTGMGITAQLLKDNGIEVYGEDELF